MGGGRGGSKRKRPNDVVGEKIDMLVAPYILDLTGCVTQQSVLCSKNYATGYFVEGNSLRFS